jgi:NAD(P)-dependent dehydrogenase (short-subunit alcohol dehydrogenase family)
MSDLDGKVAIVTGAGQGLGRGEALELARHGVRVVVNDYRDTAPGVVEQITAAGGDAVAHRGDIADWNTARELVEKAVATWGRLDILVNNAGFARDNLLFNMTEDEFDSVLRVHVKGHFCMARWASVQWRAQAKAGDGTTYARCINTTSEAALSDPAALPNYAAAKAAVLSFSGTIAQTVERIGGTSNAIAPRALTEMTETVPSMRHKEGDFEVFAVDNVVPLVAWLASPAAQRVSGQLFVVYGRRITVVAPPTVDALFEADDRWTLDGVGVHLVPFFDRRTPLVDGMVVPVGGL